MVAPDDERHGGSVQDGRGYHFTYCEPAAEDLGQGDILAKTAALSDILTDVHPHYQRKEDYTHFLVLTQTCDLVRRGDQPCKAKYVSIAAVRPLRIVLEREVAKHQDQIDRLAQVCSESQKGRLQDLVTRILNNNEPEYFYLEPEPTFGVYEPSCAFLRLSVALRAHEHYQSLLKARVLSLSEIFQAKLGWLVGNMYSRIGTQDWVPDHATEAQFAVKVRHMLGGIVLWVPPDQLKAAKARITGTRMDRDAIRKHIEQTTLPRKKDRIIEAVLQVLQSNQIVGNREAAQKAQSSLNNDPVLSSLLR
jgi:hypothetical protein